MAQLAQCVVARRPLSSPAAASRNAPVQTPATRRERPAASRSAREEALVVLEREHPGAAGHHQRVDRAAHRVEGRVGHEAHGRGAERRGSGAAIVTE